MPNVETTGVGVTEFKQLSDTPNSYVGQALKTVRVKASEDGLEFAESAGGTPSLTSILTQNKEQVGELAASVPLAGNAFTKSGCLDFEVAASSQTSVQTADGVITQLNTAGSGSASAIVRTGNITKRQMNSVSLMKFAVGGSLANVRFFVGLSNDGSGPVENDDFAGSYVGLQFSTNRGDVNLQFVLDDGTTQTLVDTGEPPTIFEVYYLRITMDDAAPSIKIELLDAAFTLIVSHTFNANLIASTLGLRYVAGVDELVASSKNLRQFFMRIVNPGQ